MVRFRLLLRACQQSIPQGILVLLGPDDHRSLCLHLRRQGLHRRRYAIRIAVLLRKQLVARDRHRRVQVRHDLHWSHNRTMRSRYDSVNIHFGLCPSLKEEDDQVEEV